MLYFVAISKMAFLFLFSLTPSLIHGFEGIVIQKCDTLSICINTFILNLKPKKETTR